MIGDPAAAEIANAVGMIWENGDEPLSLYDKEIITQHLMTISGKVQRQITGVVKDPSEKVLLNTALINKLTQISKTKYEIRKSEWQIEQEAIAAAAKAAE